MNTILRRFSTKPKPTRQSLGNFVYFHKKRIGIGLTFCGAYGLLCKYTTNHYSEAVRLGMAGSLANCACECVFHIIDTVNIRAKVDSGSKSTY